MSSSDESDDDTSKTKDTKYHLQCLQRLMKFDNTPPLPTVQQKCPYLHKMKHGPLVHKSAKSFLPFKHSKHIKMISCSDKALKKSLDEFISRPYKEDIELLKKLEVRIHHEHEDSSLFGQHGLCVIKGETLPKGTWMEYVGAVYTDEGFDFDFPPDEVDRLLSHFYRWDFKMGGKNFLICAYKHGNATAMINHHGSRPQNVQPYRAIIDGYPRLFYYITQDIVGSDDILTSELLTDYGVHFFDKSHFDSANQVTKKLFHTTFHQASDIEQRF
eukprot:TRINITY_DN408_c5_g1_i1.p1 TRINITY_DN408_c5_g1~~TRINITY_DN408_c5_g1_i1.p1  ORF type:complete len:272 (-),score=28.71 TRINITY_DN408_c5_g1_i1:239-1054(-)